MALLGPPACPREVGPGHGEQGVVSVSVIGVNSTVWTSSQHLLAGSLLDSRLGGWLCDHLKLL